MLRSSLSFFLEHGLMSESHLLVTFTDLRRKTSHALQRICAAGLTTDYLKEKIRCFFSLSHTHIRRQCYRSTAGVVAVFHSSARSSPALVKSKRHDLRLIISINKQTNKNDQCLFIPCLAVDRIHMACVT